MLPTKADVTLEGNLTGQQIQMGIDTKSLAFLQMVLTDLYSDPKLAVLREYSTNAWDSHVEAGQTKPIEVSTPSSLSPFFKVKDFGIGLDVTDIKEIYSQYGASTKRNTNDQTGMLGLGCKSALTYTNQFTINAVKNGIKTSVVVSRDAENVGAMTVVFNGPTTEPNGVEISVPVIRGDEREFANKAKDFFSFWKPGQVLLNGKEPDFVEGNYLNDEIMLSNNGDHYGYSKHRLVMGGVSYNISNDELFGDRFARGVVHPNINHSTSIVFFVSMGAVDFTPSREELHYTTRTRKKLKDLVGEFNIAVEKAIREDIAAQPSHFEALQRYNEWDEKIPDMPRDIKYSGVELPKTIEFEESYHINSWGNNRHNTDRSRIDARKLAVQKESFIVVGRQKIKELNPTLKSKLRIWAEAYGSSSPNFYFSETDAFAPWTDGIEHVSWQDILDTKVTRKVNPTVADSYWCITAYGREEKTAANVDLTKEILWANISDIPKDRLYSIWQWANRHDVQVLIVAKNKKKSFDKNFPNATYYTTWVKKKIDAFKATLTPARMEVLGFIQNHSFDSLTTFDNSTIKDKELRRVAKVAASIRASLQDVNGAHVKLKKEFYEYQAMERSIGLSTITDPENPAQILDKYPLIRYIGHADTKRSFEHVVLYINAVYDKETNAVHTI